MNSDKKMGMSLDDIIKTNKGPKGEDQKKGPLQRRQANKAKKINAGNKKLGQNKLPNKQGAAGQNSRGGQKPGYKGQQQQQLRGKKQGAGPKAPANKGRAGGKGGGFGANAMQIHQVQGGIKKRSNQQNNSGARVHLDITPKSLNQKPIRRPFRRQDRPTQPRQAPQRRPAPRANFGGPRPNWDRPGFRQNIMPAPTRPPFRNQENNRPVQQPATRKPATEQPYPNYPKGLLKPGEVPSEKEMFQRAPLTIHIRNDRGSRPIYSESTQPLVKPHPGEERPIGQAAPARRAPVRVDPNIYRPPAAAVKGAEPMDTREDAATLPLSDRFAGMAQPMPQQQVKM